MLTLKNQFIFAPIKTGYSDGSGVVTEKHLAFYKRRSQYLGGVIPEPFYMDKGLRELPTQMGIDDDNKIEGLKKLVDLIHRSGTKAIAHLNHPGRMANPKIAGNYYPSSTDKPCENGGATPNRMDREDMKKVVNLFVEGAVRAKKAGFDIIELQFGHGYLLAQFISPFVNDRTDEFGGSFGNRIRFPLEILIRKGYVTSRICIMHPPSFSKCSPFGYSKEIRRQRWSSLTHSSLPKRWDASILVGRVLWG